MALLCDDGDQLAPGAEAGLPDATGSPDGAVGEQADEIVLKSFRAGW